MQTTVLTFSEHTLDSRHLPALPSAETKTRLDDELEGLHMRYRSTYEMGGISLTPSPSPSYPTLPCPALSKETPGLYADSHRHRHRCRCLSLARETRTDKADKHGARRELDSPLLLLLYHGYYMLFGITLHKF
jgi:hypothetical protein